MPYSSYNYGYSSSGFSVGDTVNTAMIVCLILSVIAGIVVFFAFLGKKNEDRFQGFTGWLYDFLNFKKLFAESLLKAIYLIAAIFTTLESFVILFTSEANFGTTLLVFLGVLVLGNVVLRLVYEFMLVILVICRNTSDISKKLGKVNKEISKVNNDVVYEQPAEAPQAEFCTNCGEKLEPDSKFCASCGTPKE